MPIIEIKMTIDLEVEYDPFLGKTKEEFADSLEEDFHLALSEFREQDVQAWFTDVVSVKEICAN